MSGPFASVLTRRWISPLTLRIFAVNVIAVILLAGGIFYLDQLRLRLLDQRATELGSQAQLMAVALSELATREAADSGVGTAAIDWSRAVPLLERLSDIGAVRVRVIDPKGGTMQDSRLFVDAPISAQPLRPPGGFDWEQFRRRSALFFDRLLEDLGSGPVFPPYLESVDNEGALLPEVKQALGNQKTTALRRRDDDGIVMINVAVPIVSNRQVVGALLVTADTRDITRAVRRERGTSFNVFLVALSLTLLLSIFLSRTIARPLKRLAVAADRVRLGRGREVAVPRFLERNDEIGDLARALGDMTQTLHTRMDAIESFAADVAHELKNPLSSVRSAVEVMESAKTPAQRQQLLDIIRGDVGRLDRLISDISDASRLDAELSRARMAPVDLRLMLDTLVRLDSAVAKARKVNIAFTPPKAPMTVLGLELRLGQVVRNLVDNAVSFSPEGGSVRLTLERDEAWVSLAVDDDGPGIPDANREDIFKRFYSERPTEEDFGKHSGLGLAIAKQIVEAHGGQISADNRASGGARFLVRLPAA